MNIIRPPRWINMALLASLSPFASGQPLEVKGIGEIGAKLCLTGRNRPWIVLDSLLNQLTKFTAAKKASIIKGSVYRATDRTRPRPWSAM
jgi:hypothetical protein